MVSKQLSHSDRELLASYKALMSAAPLPPYDLDELYADRRVRGFVGDLLTRPRTSVS
jgi:hypothetical protein